MHVPRWQNPVNAPDSKSGAARLGSSNLSLGVGAEGEDPFPDQSALTPIQWYIIYMEFKLDFLRKLRKKICQFFYEK